MIYDRCLHVRYKVAIGAETSKYNPCQREFPATLFSRACNIFFMMYSSGRIKYNVAIKPQERKQMTTSFLLVGLECNFV